MSTLDNILYSLNESSSSLSSVDFNRHENFTNAVLRRGQVTSLIRDLNPDEKQLLKIDSNKKVLLRNGTINLNSFQKSKESKHGISSTPLRKNFDDSQELDIDDICTELERLIKIYPSAIEITDRIQYFKERGKTLNQQIETHERLVDEQKIRLADLHSSTNDLFNPKSFSRTAITQEMIAAEHRELEMLELRIAECQNEVNNLDVIMRQSR
ncbi:hypothetical protein V1514DRAFT_332099 [Lipomyces japonicus]|uniref:uncharacterized protein n=1 Tax=Lipomyces japonicus TaxID=56871 RepID=UPI0034CDF25B